jgi:hypothetical protein
MNSAPNAEWKLLSEEPILCDICNNEISNPCCRCRNCHTRWCLNCEGPTVYECIGDNHSFSESCCYGGPESSFGCIPKYGRLVDGPTFTTNYFCPQCAPESEVLEYLFKRAVRRTENKVLRQYKFCKSLGVEYLNDPANWQRFSRASESNEMEQEWIEMMHVTKMI